MAKTQSDDGQRPLRTDVTSGKRYYSYERFRQLVVEHVDATGLTARIAHALAHTMQVDWAGSKMWSV